jgi:hypothetical protein
MRPGRPSWYLSSARPQRHSREHRRGISCPAETAFQTLAVALTLVVVFVIQHTQARHLG